MTKRTPNCWVTVVYEVVLQLNKYPIRNDYISYIDGILNDMEVAERTGNLPLLMNLRKMLRGKNKASSTISSKDLNGDLILNQESLLKAWHDFLAKKFALPLGSESML